MSHWLERLVNAYAESESPPRFFYWSGMASISAVVKKNVWLNRHNYILYPNIYTFLIAASGMKKGVPVNVAKELINAVDVTRVISGRNSIQQVLSDLSRIYQTKEGPLKAAHGALLSGEFAAFLTGDPDSLTILTDLHDTHYNEKEWKYSLKSGISKLTSPCLTLLGATNEEHFDEAVPAPQIGGGFIARTFIVYAQIPGNYNSLMYKPTSRVVLSDFVPYLYKISQLKGEMHLSDAAKVTYDEFYYPHVKGIVEDRTGTLRRLGDQVLKASMLISLSSSLEMVIEANHIEEAIKECKVCAASVNRVTQGSGKGIMTKPISLILRSLLKAPEHTILRSKFLKQFWSEGLTAQEFDVSIETFIASGAIRVNGTGLGISYTLEERVAEEYGRQEQRLRGQGA